MRRSFESTQGPHNAALRVSGNHAAQRAPGLPAGSGVHASVLLAYLGLVLLLGGGTRNHLLTDLVLQLLAVPILAMTLLPWLRASTNSSVRDWLLLLVAFCLLPMLHLMPLPGELWAMLPGRSDIVADIAALGLPSLGWQPLSLDPGATQAGLRALLPGLAVALLLPMLDHAWRRRCLYMVIAAAVVSVPIGVAQLQGGPQSELRFYTPTNVHDAVGLFANRNHYAALLYSALALALVFLLGDLKRVDLRPGMRPLRMLLWALVAVALVIGLATTRSRAGMLMVALGALAVSVLALRAHGRKALPWLLGGAVLVLALIVHLGLDWILERAQQLWSGDHRLTIMAASTGLAAEFGWLGVGPGAFPVAYAAYEPLELIGAKIVNHAHNDWLEWWLEIGLLLPLMGLLVGGWLWRRLRNGHGPLHVYAQGALLVLLLNLIHALFDYQLRTSTMMVVVVLCCACLLPGRDPPHKSPPGMRPRLRPVDA